MDFMAETQMTTATPKPNYARYLVIGAIIILGLALLLLLFGGSRTSAEPAAITGMVDFNGITPEDASNPELGQIKLLARDDANSSDDYTDTLTPIHFSDNAVFRWDLAESGVTYDLKAEVYYKGQLIQTSLPVTVTAPANGVILRFNVELQDIPENLRPTPAPDVTPAKATVSGVVTINGFIPTGSRVEFFARLEGTEDEFTEVGDPLPAANGVRFDFENADPGVTYEYQAELYNSVGTFIGESNFLTVTAPASNEVVVINSTATPPSQAAAISGTITLNGSLVQNSTVILLQRKAGESDYSVVDRFAPTRTIEYKWSDAVGGTAYDMTAALQVNEANTATGNVRTVTAPASDVAITIDTGVNLPAPTQTPSVACGDADATNHFNAVVSLPQIGAAKKYYLEVGTSAGANNTFRGEVNPNATATVFVPASSPHFARYSYTSCTDCDITDTTNWAGWSPTLGFQCPN
jgi:hypothetical protein